MSSFRVGRSTASCSTCSSRGILVALPHNGWIAIDGCEVRGESCIGALLERWKSNDERLELVVLTHPHDDHAAGIPFLLEKHNPREVMVTGQKPAGLSLVRQAEGLIHALRRAVTEEGVQLRHAKKALDAIAAWAEGRGPGLIAGADGVSRTWGATSAAVRAPHDCTHLASVLSELARGEFKHANEASVVLELVFGGTRVVLGGDLPVRRTAGGTIDTGWDGVMSRHPGLASHSALKIAHHGSEHAQHAALLTAAESVWFVTPGHQRLPRAFENSGLRALVATRPVHATAPPSDATIPSGANLDAVRVDALTPRDLGSSDPALAGAVEVTPREPSDAVAPVWGAAFDSNGGVRGIWRGTFALRFIA